MSLQELFIPGIQQIIIYAPRVCQDEIVFAIDFVQTNKWVGMVEHLTCICVANQL